MEQELQQQAIPEETTKPLDRNSAIESVLNTALHAGGVVKGIAETLKSLESQKVKLVFLAEDCDSQQYKDTITALAQFHKVPLVLVETWIQLKDYCKLGLPSETIRKIAEDKGKEAKIKPKCSACAIVDWGEDTEARKFLEKLIVEENHSA